MAKLSAHGKELFRYFSMKDYGLVAIMEDGQILRKTPLSTIWKKYRHKKPGVDMGTWRSVKQGQYDRAPEWAKNCKTVPTYETMQRWERDCMCKTPTGHVVEADGEGPDGVPSWLILLGLI